MTPNPSLERTSTGMAAPDLQQSSPASTSQLHTGQCISEQTRSLQNSNLACPEGLEPPTCCLEGSCSIQLSYGQRGANAAEGMVGVR
jgi:hypothetical protein